MALVFILFSFEVCFWSDLVGMGRYGTTEALVVHLIRSNLCSIHRRSYGNVIIFTQSDMLVRITFLGVPLAHLDIFFYPADRLQVGRDLERNKSKISIIKYEEEITMISQLSHVWPSQSCSVCLAVAHQGTSL